MTPAMSAFLCADRQLTQRSPSGSLAWGWSQLVFTALAWGLNWPVLKLAVAEFNPFGFRAITGLGGVALLLAIALVRGDRLAVPRGQLGWLVLTAILNVTSMMGLATVALLWLRASEAVIVAYTIPVWTTLLAWPVLGERPKALGVVGLLLGFSGVVTLVAGDVLTLSAAEFAFKLPGFLLITGTALMFSLGTVLTKRRPIVMPPVPQVAWQVSIGLAPLLVAAIIFERWDFSHVTALGWASAGYVTVIALCGAYLTWFGALRILPASTATVGMLLVPIIGVLSSALVLGDPLGARHFVALGLTITGVFLSSRA